MEGWRCGQASWECQALPRTDWQVEARTSVCVDSATKKAALGTANHTADVARPHLRAGAGLGIKQSSVSPATSLCLCLE